MAELNFNIARLQQCLDVTVGTPSVGDVVTVSSTSPLQFDLAPGGGGGGGIVTSIGSHDPIQVDSTNPAIPSISVLEADTGQSGVVSTGKQYFDGNKVFNDGAKWNGTPSSNDDLVNKQYVDTFAAGLKVVGSVRAATLVAGNLSTDFAAGHMIDGVTLAFGNRILIKNQSNAIENGIYTVNNSGAPTRATDYDSATECAAGTFTTVLEGSQDNTQWSQTSTPSVPNTDPLVFTKLAISAGVTSIESPQLGTLTGAVTLNGKDIYYSGYSGNTVYDELALKAPSDSPVFTGTPTTPDQTQNALGDKVVNQKYVATAISNFNGTLSGAYVPTSGLTGSGFVKKSGTSYVIDTNAYVTSSYVASNYLTQANAASTYLTQANASSTYLTQTNASSTYLTQSNASSTYQPLKSTIKTDSNTSYQFVLTDATGYKYIRHTAGSTVTATVPSGVFSAGDTIYGIQAGAGKVVITPAGGVTINSADGATKTRAQYSSYMLICTGSNTFDLIGDISTY